MSLLPEPVPLDPPSGSPEAVTEAADGVAAAARLLDELTDGLGRAWTPAWHGADAEAADERRGRIAGFGGDVAEALQRAAVRLRSHSEVVGEVTARIAALRATQDEEFAYASRRIAGPVDVADLFGPPPDAVLDELSANEATRGAEHRALTARLAEDSAETIRVLVGCAGVVSGTPTYDEGRALLRLASLLPEWAAQELPRRARELVQAVTEQGPAGWEAVAGTVTAVAAQPEFASALLEGLGVEGMRRLLLDLDHVELGVGSDLAAVLAAAFGAAARLARPGSGVRAVLEARWIDADKWNSLPDSAARGLAVIALTGAQRGQLPTGATLRDWAGQMVAREAVHGPMPDRLGLATDGAASADPLYGLIQAVVVADDAGATAGLLSGADLWAVLLSRSWHDGGDMLRLAAGQLAGAPPAVGGPSVLAALEATGTALEDGHPDGWTVDRSLMARVAPALGEAVAAHTDAVAELLQTAVDSCPSVEEGAALRGLGYLTIDPEATKAVLAGLERWMAGQASLELRDITTSTPVIAVPAGFVAVREWGQRLDFALRSHELAEVAARDERRWDWTVGLLVDVAMNTVGKRVPFVDPLVTVVETTVRRWVGADGRFDVGTDRGLHFDAEDVTEALPESSGDPDGHLRRLAAAAAEAFSRTAGVLPEPVVARSDDDSLSEQVLDDLSDPGLPGRSRRPGRELPPVDVGLPD